MITHIIYIEDLVGCLVEDLVKEREAGKYGVITKVRVFPNSRNIYKIFAFWSATPEQAEKKVGEYSYKFFNFHPPALKILKCSPQLKLMPMS